jgi:hypothetical protein
MALTDIYVEDALTGEIHRVGDDEHDGLCVSNGVVRYENVGNGRSSSEWRYSFVESDFGEK